MAYVPPAFCANCNTQLVIEKNGVRLDVRTKDGEQYYFLPSDIWKCPSCDLKVHLGFNHRINPIESHSPEYPNLVKNAKVVYLK